MTMNTNRFEIDFEDDDICSKNINGNNSNNGNNGTAGNENNVINWDTAFIPDTLEEGCWNHLFKEMNEWYKKFNQVKKNKRCGGKGRLLYLMGDNGVGKSCLAHLFLKKMGYRDDQICTHYITDIRGRDEIRDVLLRSCQYYSISDAIRGNHRPLALIIKEIDELSIPVADFVKHICEIPIAKQGPIICIGNNTYMKTLASISVVVKVGHPSNYYLKQIIGRICAKMNLQIDNDYYFLIANRAHGDIRCLIHCLYDVFLMFGPNKPIDGDMLKRCLEHFGIKDMDVGRFEAIRRIINTQDTLGYREMEKMYQMDTNLIPLYLWENIGKIFVGNDFFGGYQAISNLMTYDMMFNVQDEYLKFSLAGGPGCLGQRCYLPVKTFNGIPLASSTLYNRSTQKKKEIKNLRLLPGELQLSLNSHDCLQLSQLYHHYISAEKNTITISETNPDNETITDNKTPDNNEFFNNLLNTYHIKKTDLTKIISLTH